MKEHNHLTPDKLDAEIDRAADEAAAEALSYWERVKALRGDPGAYQQYIASLRQKNPLELTAEEIGVLHDDNENFHGQIPGFEKINQYRELEEAAQGFMDGCDEVVQIEKLRPNPRERHALLSVDLNPIATLDQREADLLVKLLQMAFHSVMMFMLSAPLI